MRNARESGTAGLTRLHVPWRPANAPSRPAGRPAHRPRGSIALAASALALGGLLHALPAQAIEFGDGELQGSLDTTISHGVTFRVAKRDPELSAGANDNDGNLNYDRGLVSNASKFTTDLDIGFGRFGAFLRTTGFLDYENRNGTRDRTPLSDAAQDRVGRDLEVLDAYVSAAFDAGDAAVDFRLGKHVLNWGESTFIPNGINAINPFDVSKLRRPGSELREALLPVGLVSLSVAPTDLLSVEGFYQFDWEPTEIDPVGSYFSVTDYAGPGAKKAVIDLLPELGLGDMGLTAENNPFRVFSATSVAPVFSPVTTENPEFLMAPRDADREADDSGQWGIAFRYLAEELNNTEFGFYYMNYHSRLPVVGAHTGTAVDAGVGLAIAGAIGDPTDPGSAAYKAVMELVNATVSQALAAAGCASATARPDCGALEQRVRAQAAAQFGGLAGAAAAAAGIDAYAENGYYFLEYPEDIQLFGVSFNTEIGASGWALQGEYSYRRDAPLQFAERKVFADALAPFTELEACIEGKVPGLMMAGLTLQQAQGRASQLCIAEYAAAGRYDADTVGYVRRNVSQVQATATKVFGPNGLGADAMVFVAEAALMRVHDMPQGKGVPAAELTPGDMPLESPAGGKHGEGEADADATSWGYRLAARLDYNNAIGPVNLYPYTQFAHDVNGNSPAPAGPFVEGRTALTLGLRADYLSRWEADIGYTRYAGKGTELADRDFISASVKYSF